MFSVYPENIVIIIRTYTHTRTHTHTHTHTHMRTHTHTHTHTHTEVESLIDQPAFTILLCLLVYMSVSHSVTQSHACLHSRLTWRLMLGTWADYREHFVRIAPFPTTPLHLRRFCFTCLLECPQKEPTLNRRLVSSSVWCDIIGFILWLLILWLPLPPSLLSTLPPLSLSHLLSPLCYFAKK